MNVHAHEGGTYISNFNYRSRSFGLWFVVGWSVLFWSVLFWSGQVLAQAEPLAPIPADTQPEAPAVQQGLSEDTVEVIVSLPTGRQLAMALATPALRNEALLDLAAAQNIVNYAEQNNAVDSPALAQKFLDDRGWLARLVERYGWVQPHTAVLDPAAWLVLAELQQHELWAMSLVQPNHMPTAVLVYQVFQRAGERLAAANLPILLLRLEPEAISVWNAFLQLTGSQGSSEVEWKKVETEWFAARQFPSPMEFNGAGQDRDQARDRQPSQQGLPVTEYLQNLSQLVLSAVDVRPPDARRLKELRYSLLNDASTEMSGLAVVDKEQGRDMLQLASLVDGLQDGRYFDFVQGLLAITSGLLDRSGQPADIPLLVDWLLTELPAISAHYAVGFAAVDPKLNTAMAAAYKVLQDIADPAGDAVKAPRAMLADAVVQLALMIPDMGYYFNTPMRARIAEEINICTSIAASRDAEDYPAMTRSQYDACIESFLQLADEEARLPELSGNFNGPFSTDSLRRELSVTPAQRINYGIGYLHNRYATDCAPPVKAMPNPLEWAVLATTMTWFAESSPEFFLTPENETRLARMRSIGEQLIAGLAEQASCFAGAGINDLVSRISADYETSWRALDAGIVKAEAGFRAEQLRPGADISLHQDASQPTGYRPDDLIIKPCNPQRVCEMSGSLSTTRALIGLFPDEYLVAEQSGLGKIGICYRNMEWVDRRSELVRPDDENVANYYGHLGFDLVGRYSEDGRSSDLFDFRFTSPEEYHYLFAQASGEVLQDSCPVKWVGTRIITPLREDRGGIVPNRLTYLAASRASPSRLLQANWDRGAEWRDWFVTGLGVSAVETGPIADIKPRLNQHLQSLYQAEQAEIYQRILLPKAHNSRGENVSLFNEMSQISIAKALLRMQMMLFYPDSLSGSDAIRMAITGDAGLLEGRTLRRFQEDNVALTSVNRIARERLRRLQSAWSEQPEAVRREGSISASLMHALTRINFLYRQFFTSRPEPLDQQRGRSKVPE